MIRGTTEAWESGALGLTQANAKAAPAELEAAVDEALGLQAISIRLPKGLIEAYKMLAKMHGIGYQPLMRDALQRFVEGEMKLLLIGAAEEQTQRQAEAEQPSDASPPLRHAA
ncbi:hypothetical protein KGA65_14645 [Ideonella sp. B7]|nr:hypothetical protein [Ideonella benzenivorans]